MKPKVEQCLPPSCRDEDADGVDERTTIIFPSPRFTPWEKFVESWSNAVVVPSESLPKIGRARRTFVSAKSKYAESHVSPAIDPRTLKVSLVVNQRVAVTRRIRCDRISSVCQT